MVEAKVALPDVAENVLEVSLKQPTSHGEATHCFHTLFSPLEPVTTAGCMVSMGRVCTCWRYHAAVIVMLAATC